MKIIEFAFSGKENTYLPHNYTKNTVVYTGTHDNETIMEWYKNISKKEKKYAKNYVKLSKKEGYNWGFIRLAYASVSNVAIIPIQDFLGLGANCRMNTPSTMGGNWKFRISPNSLTPELSKKIRKLTKLYARYNKENDKNKNQKI